MIKVSSLLMLYQSLSEFNLKSYIVLILKMIKIVEAFTFFRGFKLGLIPSKIAANINRSYGEGSNCN